MDRHPKLLLRQREHLVLDALEVEAPSASDAAAIVDALIADDDHRAELARWLGVVEDELRDAAVRERAMALLVEQCVMVVQNDAGEADERDPTPGEDPVEPPRRDPKKDERPTWIAITVLDESGGVLAGTRWSLVLADGDERSMRLDERSSWRADDLRTRGTCHLRVADDRLEAGPRLAGWTGPQPDDEWMSPGPGTSIMVATGRSHRVLIVHGRTEIVLLDELDRPIAHEACSVRVAGGLQRGVTDADGNFTVWHPDDVESLHVEFPAMDASAWALERTEELT